MLLQASSSVLSAGPFAEFDFSHRYFSAVLQFIGIPSVEVIYVEGMNATPDNTSAIKEKAMKKAHEMTSKF
jgi:FMN-dependent NADH-azoreductase